LLVRVAENAVVREGRVGDVGAAETRHVASSAVVIFLAPLHDGQAATGLLMTLQATAAVVSRFLVCRWQGMRVMARNAAHLAVAFPEAAAGDHLLHLAHRFVIVRKRRTAHVDRPELV